VNNFILPALIIDHLKMLRDDPNVDLVKEGVDVALRMGDRLRVYLAEGDSVPLSTGLAPRKHSSLSS